MKLTKIIAFMLVVCMLVVAVASCGDTKQDETTAATTAATEATTATTEDTLTVVQFSGDYTYKDAVTTLSGN